MLALFFFFSFHYSFAEVDISADNANTEISQDTTWTPDAGPYVIDQTLTVDAGVTLTIQPGTVVKFDYGQSLNVSGNLVADGTVDDPIYFTSLYDDSVGGDINPKITFESDGDGIDDTIYDPAPDYGDWRGITISSGGNYDIEHTTIVYANTAINTNSATGTIDSATISHGQYAFVFQNNSQASISNADINDMLSGGIVLLSSNASISASTMQNIDGIAVDDLNSSSLDLENSTLENISSTAILLYPASTASINHSTITDSGGIEAYQNSSFTFKNSGMKNISGMSIDIDGSSADMNNSTIDTASAGIEASDNSTTMITDSSIENISAGSAIETFNGGSLTLSNSTLTTMTGTALEAYTSAWSGYGSTTVTIASSTISEGESDGLEIFGMVNTNITGSIVSNFIGDGLQTFSYPIINISASTITGTNNGIESYGANVTISNSTIANNATFGVTDNPASSGAPAIIAENNWWGDPSGPFNIDMNATGTANSVSDNVDFIPWLTSPPGAKPTCCSNVLFIPGLEGSRLYDADGNRIWEPNPFGDSSKINELDLNADGEPTDMDIYTKDIIDDAYVSDIGNVYASFISTMNKMKSAGTINDWSAAPYDWRLSLADILNNGNENSDGKIYYSGDTGSTTSPYIISELKKLAASSQTGKVTIIAHSNGGLLTKALTDALGSDASTLIDKIIFVAVPQTGTPQAIGAILHGFDTGLPFDGLPIFFNPSDGRALAQNMPTAYDLLPSADYFSTVADPVVTFDDSSLLAPWRVAYGNRITSQSVLADFMTDASREVLPTTNTLTAPTFANENLLDNAETLHENELDAWAPPDGVALTEIAGWGINTLKTISYYQGYKTECPVQSDYFSTCPVSMKTTPILQYDPVMTS